MDTGDLATRSTAVLVGGVKSRRAGGAPAQDLYTSHYFAKMRCYAESTGRPWFILSPGHGLVAPDAWLESDDCSLFNRSRDYRREWGLRVAGQLAEAVGPVRDSVFDVHAGAAYVRAVYAALDPQGAIVLDRLKGMPLGRRLAWYLQQHQRPPTTEPTRP